MPTFARVTSQSLTGLIYAHRNTIRHVTVRRFIAAFVFCLAIANLGGLCYAQSLTKYSGGHTIVRSADPDRCYALHDYAAHSTDPREAYDSAKVYTVTCPLPDAVSGFGYAANANDDRDTSFERYTEFREWLKSVLYLHEDTIWYCSDVINIMRSVGVFCNGQHEYAHGVIGIANYILDHDRCPDNKAGFRKVLESAMELEYPRWRDTVKDSLKTPFDSTGASLEELDLSLLRQPKQSVAVSGLAGEEHLSALHVSENPFQDRTSVTFNLKDYGLVTFELFDALGNRVFENGLGRVLDPGEHEFEIPGRDLAEGVYFARVSYHNGDTKTIMVQRR